MESRFEVLEEETHFPASRAQAAVEKPEESATDDAAETLVAALETQLEQLALGGESVKSASRAKELGNECVSFSLFLIVRGRRSVFVCSAP